MEIKSVYLIMKKLPHQIVLNFNTIMTHMKGFLRLTVMEFLIIVIITMTWGELFSYHWKRKSVCGH